MGIESTGYNYNPAFFASNTQYSSKQC